MDSIFVKYNPQISAYESMLVNEYGQNAILDKSRYYQNAEKIREALPDYIKKVNNGLYDSITLPIRKPSEYQDSIDIDLSNLYGLVLAK